MKSVNEFKTERLDQIVRGLHKYLEYLDYIDIAPPGALIAEDDFLKLSLGEQCEVLYFIDKRYSDQ